VNVEFFKNIANTFQSKKSASASSNAIANQFGLGNIASDIDVPINTNVNVDARTRNFSDSRQFVDARQISIISESPNSTLTTKKSDSINKSDAIDQAGGTTPISVTPTVPVDLGLQVPSFSGLSNILLLGGLGVGGFFLIKGLTKNKGGK
jgi:hypothetical protein